MEYLAKGKRGIVYRDGDLVVKKNNPTTTSIGHLKHEFNVLKEVNVVGIGPKVISFVDEKLTMEFIDGVRIIDYFETVEKNEIISIIKKVFDQLRKLDELKINKSELTYPYKHILIRNNEPVMIDFERARKTLTPSNVTQFCQFVTSKGIEKLFKEKSLDIDKDKILKAAKNYKDTYSQEDYERIIELL